jgi:hypothetical protein
VLVTTPRRGLSLSRYLPCYSKTKSTRKATQ